MTTLLVFPLDPAARASFRDDFGAPRSGGRTHQGIDIVAAEGTAVLAVVPGRLTFDQNTLGGNVAYIRTPDRTWFYFAHLSAFEGTARQVEAGETIGYVGHTGNATGPHLHFEIHPGGGEAVDPFPFLSGEPLRLGRAPSWPRSAAWIGGSLGALAGLGAALRGAAP